MEYEVTKKDIAHLLVEVDYDHAYNLSAAVRHALCNILNNPVIKDSADLRFIVNQMEGEDSSVFKIAMEDLSKGKDAISYSRRNRQWHEEIAQREEAEARAREKRWREEDREEEKENEYTFDPELQNERYLNDRSDDMIMSNYGDDIGFDDMEPEDLVDLLYR